MMYIIRFVIFLSVILLITGCRKEEIDTDIPEGVPPTVIKGKIMTTGGVGLPNIKLKIGYAKTYESWFGKHLYREKASAVTNKNGEYRMLLYIREDETTSEEHYLKKYIQEIDLQGLDKEQFITPVDLGMQHDVYSSYLSLRRDTVYEADFYVPRKRKIPITLKGYVLSDRNGFTVYSTLPWGYERIKDGWISVPHWQKIQTKWHEQTCTIGQFRVIRNGDHTFSDVPVALHDTTILTVWREKENGIGGLEEVKIFATETEPAALSFDF